ncbi:MAG: hypothetical protein P1U86_05945 [Verrucomicrobiales bacterium]|nr:hypothetical protein [Verrucomicrobiales bacterium]
MNSSVVSRSVITVVSVVVFGFAIYFGRSLISQLFPEDRSNDLVSTSESGELSNTDEGRKATGVSDDKSDANDTEPGEGPSIVESAETVEPEGASEADVEVRKSAFEGYFEPAGFESPSKEVVISAEASMPASGDGDLAFNSESDRETERANLGAPPKADGPDEAENDPEITPPVVDELVDTTTLIDTLESAEARAKLSVGTGDGSAAGLAIAAGGSEVAAEVASGVTDSLPLPPVVSTVDLNTAPVADLPAEVVGELVNAPAPARAPQATLERAPRPGMIYSNALGGSVSGLIGGMDRPASSTSRVRDRDEVVSGGYAGQGGGASAGIVVNQASVNGGVAAGMPSTAPSLPVSQLPSIIGPAAGNVTGSTGGIVPPVPTATTSGAEALNAVVPSVSVGLPGLGINTGGAGVGVNLNLNLP